MSDLFLIGCIPLAARDTPPPEQRNCQALPCENCGGLMWVSQAKLDVVKSSPMKPTLWCFDCIILTYPRECEDIEPVDITQIDWGKK